MVIHHQREDTKMVPLSSPTCIWFRRLSIRIPGRLLTPRNIFIIYPYYTNHFNRKLHPLHHLNLFPACYTNHEGYFFVTMCLHFMDLQYKHLMHLLWIFGFNYVRVTRTKCFALHYDIFFCYGTF